MKRFTLIVAMVIMMTLPMMAERVTPETARKVATTFLNNNGAKTNQLTDISKDVGFPNLFIFTTESSFIIMAADDCVQPVLGYSLTGNFITEDMPENVRGWLQGYNDEIQSAIENQQKATTETTKLWKELTNGNSKVAKATTVVAPLIQTKWNQNKYYNNLCPPVSDGIDGHAYTGCVATAMAQIMKYWEYPTHGISSNSYTWNNQTLSADFGATTYDWDNMNDYYEYYYDDGGTPHWLPNPTSAEIAAVATLMYHCGVSVNMYYGGSSTGGSSASNSAVATALKTYFNYSLSLEYKQKSYTNLQTQTTITYYTDAEWIAMLKTELDAQRPLQYGGQDPNGNSGHAFVCDGYNSNDYFHFNWGWAGAYNGYFSIDNLNTGANSGQSGAGNGVYTRNQDAVFGIQPVQCAASEPTNLTYTLNGTQLTLNWTAANGASSYNIYCNDNYVGNSTTNSYSEAAPFGTNVYYVRSVDANGNLSLSSNSVTVNVSYQTPIVDDLEGTLSGNNVTLSWTAPEWCYPETPSATLTYGDGTFSGYSLGFNNGNSMYWGHQYLSGNLNAYNNMAIYKISFYANATGAYMLYVYEGTTSNYPQTKVLEQSVNVGLVGWFDIDLSNTLIIDASKDYWVFLYDPEGRNYPAAYGIYSGSYGNYYSSAAPTSWVSTVDGLAFLIRTYVTDGTYTYILYRNDAMIAQNLSSTTYNTQLAANNANLFTVKTNYYGGETEPSNKVGFTKGNASLSTLNLNDSDRMTITENSSLTISGTLSNDNSASLILEDGAQLVHNSANVKATVKKDIAPYTQGQNDGWNFIASPIIESITPSVANGLLTNSYDLYKFDQSENQEWRNLEAGAFSTIDHKTGYLYANSANSTLNFEGTLVASAQPTALIYDASATFKGFNLIGNPYPCNTTINKDFYVIENNTITLAGTGRVIAPCEGVFVKANSNNESVTFTKGSSAKDRDSMDCLDIVVAQNQTNIDRARVRFGEGIGMEKFIMDNHHSQISLRQDHQDFAVAYTNGQTELPLSFKASQNGTYTLNIEAENLDMDYLHLIDNMTGNDINMLVSPTYTFEAKVSDYASRFRLLFAPDEEIETANEAFGFIADGKFRLTNREGLLQVIDTKGTILKTADKTNEISLSELSAGAYVVRLVTAESVMTQKIVVE